MADSNSRVVVFRAVVVGVVLHLGVTVTVGFVGGTVV